MAALGRSKRVSWPSDGNLCKVRLFLSEDEPLKSVHGSEDHLQEKSAHLLAGEGLNELNIPPGFEPAYRNHPKIQIPQIPLIEWQRPHTLVLKQEWLVVAGEESQEVYLENARQQGVLEAIYPRPSSIPPNPLVSADIEFCSCPDDSNTLHIPITAPEDEDAADQPEPLPLSPTTHAHVQSHNRSNSHAAQNHHNNPTSSAPLFSSAKPTATAAALDAEPEVAAAANVAYAIIKSTEEGSLIDPDLLIKLLHEPAMVNELLSRYNVPKPTQPASRHGAAAAAAASQALNRSVPLSTLPLDSLSKAAPTQAKDASYYKSLIQLHGGDSREASDAANVKRADFRGRVEKPCVYFNTPKGCRNGARCLFLHDVRVVSEHAGASKRIKLGGRTARRF